MTPTKGGEAYGLVPGELTLDNYLVLFFPESVKSEHLTVTLSVIKPLFNSIICAGTGTLLALIIGMLAAYSVSRYKFGGSFFPFFILTLRMIPPVAILVPILILYSAIKWIDTLWGLTLAYALFPIPFVIWLMKSFFDDVPTEVDEAAIMDGCSRFRTFYKVVLPLVTGGIAVTALFVFLLNWSDFIVALVLTQSKTYTMPVLLNTYRGAFGQLYGPIAAFGLFATIPPLIIGILIQRYLVRGFTFGAIKR
jgi:multiple sugar transport system permease protein